MGINFKLLTQLEGALEQLNQPMEEIKMVEFGAQRVVSRGLPKSHPSHGFINSKEYFISLGMSHISLDINNKWDSLYLDLSKIHEKWKNHFDVVTDYGTSEHVMFGQYQVFANAHNFTRLNGIMTHCLPMVGRIQKGHPIKNTVYYHEDFYHKLAELNDYEMLDFEIMKGRHRKGGNVTCVLRKTLDNEFCSEKDFWLMKAIDDYSRGQKLTKDRFKYVSREDN